MFGTQIKKRAHLGHHHGRRRRHPLQKISDQMRTVDRSLHDETVINSRRTVASSTTATRTILGDIDTDRSALMRPHKKISFYHLHGYRHESHHQVLAVGLADNFLGKIHAGNCYKPETPRPARIIAIHDHHGIFYIAEFRKMPARVTVYQG